VHSTSISDLGPGGDITRDRGAPAQNITTKALDRSLCVSVYRSVRRNFVGFTPKSVASRPTALKRSKSPV